VAKKQIARIAARSPLPIYLPNAITIGGRNMRAYATGGTTRNGWDIEFAYVPNCGGANACAMASFTAIKRRRLWEPANVTLARGIRGRFNRISCGASCGPAQISFVIDGVLYEFDVKDPAGRQRTAMVALANQAITYGPR
jgi:hypothetical protein